MNFRHILQKHLPTLLAIPLVFVVSLARSQDSQPSTPGSSKTPAAKRPVIGSQYIPNEAIAMLVASPAELNATNKIELFPNEVIRAKMLEQFGLDPNELTSVRIIVGMPGPRGPSFAIVGESAADVQWEPFLSAINASTPPTEVDGRSVYELQNPPDSWLHLMGPRKAVVANQGWLDTVLTAEQGEGALAKLADKMPQPAGVTLMV